MGNIVVSENISLDGLAGGGALFDYVGRVTGEVATFFFEEALASEALLLGRRGYEFFAGRWPSRTGAYADRLNSMPKYVLSSTLEDPAWNNTTVISGDPLVAVAKLKQQTEGEIVVYGSIRLVRALMENDLVDELRLVVYPVVLGDGEHLFGETSAIRPMRLVSARTTQDGIGLQAYQPVRDT